MLQHWTKVDPYEGRTDIDSNEVGVLADLKKWFEESMFAYKQDLFFQFLSSCPYALMQRIRRTYINKMDSGTFTSLEAVLEVLRPAQQLHNLIRFLQDEEWFEQI